MKLIVSLLIIVIIYITYIYRQRELFKNINDNETYTAIIIEPRNHKALEFVLLNFLENLDYKWNFLIFHGTQNKDYLIEILNKYPQYTSRIKTVNLEVSNLSIDDYNRLLFSHEFYDNIDTEIFLIFQTDSMICRENKTLINEYIGYDYVGAPWSHRNMVGNGGLSLRRKSKMLEILQNCPIGIDMNEDVFFSYGCKDHIPYKPLIDEAKRFSVESMFIDNPFGHHKSWINLPQYIYRMNRQCENYNKLISLNTQKRKEYISESIILVLIIILVYRIYNK